MNPHNLATQPTADAPPLQAVQKVVFLSRERAEVTRGEPGAVIVSIHDASEPAATLRTHWAERLTLKFHDTEDEEGVQTPYTDTDARQVLQMVLRHRHTAPAIYVHCRHGQSRSAGIAIAISELLEVPCFKHRDQVSREKYPHLNRRVYRRTRNLAEQEFRDDFF